MATALEQLCEKRGLGPEELAVYADLDPATVRRALAGANNLRPRTVIKLARALRIPPRRLQVLLEESA